MKLNYTTANGRVSVEFDGNSQKEFVKQIAAFEEVFGETKCGKCDSENIKFVVRTVNGNDYYELRCNDCGAKLAFGQQREGGGLFPKRKDDDGWLPDNGWVKWNKETGKNE